jgi:ATP-dependent Clp protease ATP-binding subunit ClpA
MRMVMMMMMMMTTTTTTTTVAGELRAMGATTLDEYRNYIEKDPALARRFVPVFIPEPDLEDTLSILRLVAEDVSVCYTRLC